MATRIEDLHRRARQALGEQRTLSIGGGAQLPVVEASGEFAQSFAELVHTDEDAITVSAPRGNFEAYYPLALSSYTGEDATLNTAPYRVAGIQHGRFVTRIKLVSRDEGQ